VCVFCVLRDEWIPIKKNYCRSFVCVSIEQQSNDQIKTFPEREIERVRNV
jgi:hypothetical protein